MYFEVRANGICQQLGCVKYEREISKTPGFMVPATERREQTLTEMEIAMYGRSRIEPKS